MGFSLKKFNIWLPLMILLVNIILFSFLVEELVAASSPNYGVIDA